MPDHHPKPRKPRRPSQDKPRETQASRAPQEDVPTYSVHPLGFWGYHSKQRFRGLIQGIEKLVSSAIRRELSAEIQRLSESLAKHRGSTVQQDYLNRPLTQLAYVAHFLPWNVLRLAMAWRMSRPRMTKESDTWIVEDWGSGPLTALMALWVTGLLPRESKTVFRAVERNRDILNLGTKLWKSIPDTPTVRVETRHRLLDFDDDFSGSADVDLLIASEAFNEWLPVRGRDDASIRAFLKAAQATLKSDGELFVMEPASRIVSWGVMQLRQNICNDQKRVLAPCTHHDACPLLGPRVKRWCHFRSAIHTLPDMRNLTALSDLPKDALALSFLHSRPNQGQEDDALREARVLSDCFTLQRGEGAYACGSEGLLLIESSKGPWPEAIKSEGVSGTCLKYRKQRRKVVDKRSGASRIALSDCRFRSVEKDKSGN